MYRARHLQASSESYSRKDDSGVIQNQYRIETKLNKAEIAEVMQRNCLMFDEVHSPTGLCWVSALR
jgi:hypothetical protein